VRAFVEFDAQSILEQLRVWGRFELFRLGASPVTLGGLLGLVVLTGLLVSFSRRATGWLVRRLEARGTDAGVGPRCRAAPT
jgi:hypothetical protein